MEARADCATAPAEATPVPVQASAEAACVQAQPIAESNQASAEAACVQAQPIAESNQELGIEPEVLDETEPKPKTKKVRLLGFQIEATEAKAQRALLYAGVGLVVLNGFGLPFALPKLRRFLGAPYVPMKKVVVDSLFDRVLPGWVANRAQSTGKLTASGGSAGDGASSLAGLRLVDFGSGDGRIVAAAAHRGMHAVGYEINPYLVLLARLRHRQSLAQAPGTAEFRWGNAWKADVKKADVLTIYGRPGDNLMMRFADKCSNEMQHNSAVVSHFFDIPQWGRMLVQDVDGLKLYDLSRRRQRSRTPE